jgi:DNA-binding HxlR family transcriptional regulator
VAAGPATAKPTAEAVVGAVRRRDVMLAQTLRTLEDDGVVLRRDFAEVPPRVEYELTPIGRQLAKCVAALATWISDNTAKVLAACEKRPRAGVPA